MNSLFDHLDAHGDRIRDPAFEKDLWLRFGAEHTVVVVDMAGFTRVSHEKGVLYYLTLIQEMRALTRPLSHAFPITVQLCRCVKGFGDEDVHWAKRLCN